MSEGDHAGRRLPGDGPRLTWVVEGGLPVRVWCVSQTWLEAECFSELRVLEESAQMPPMLAHAHKPTRVSSLQ